MKDAPKKKRRGVGRIAFLARLEDFRKLVDAGWPITAIYEDHGGSETGLSYSQFVRYIGKHLRPPIPRGSTLGAEVSLVASQTQPTTVSRRTAQSEVRSRKPEPFQHNPNGGNDRDDLI